MSDQEDTVSQSQPVLASNGHTEAEPSAAEMQRRLLRHKLHMGDLGSGPVWDALASLDTLVTYGRWQVGPESLSHHPTLPSAVAEARATLDAALAALSSEASPLGAEPGSTGTDWRRDEQEPLPLPTREAEPSGGWLPIESAPRDGTRIVVLVGARPKVLAVHWYKYTGKVPGDHDGWVDDYGHDIPWRQELVSHWMPLPEPPRDQQVERESSRETIDPSLPDGPHVAGGGE